jgi:hypothetical protein
MAILSMYIGLVSRQPCSHAPGAMQRAMLPCPGAAFLTSGCGRSIMAPVAECITPPCMTTVSIMSCLLTMFHLSQQVGASLPSAAHLCRCQAIDPCALRQANAQLRHSRRTAASASADTPDGHAPLLSLKLLDAGQARLPVATQTRR